MLICPKKLPAVVLLLCYASVAALGQVSRADLHVVVVDPAEAVIAGAIVELRRGGNLVGSTQTMQAQGASFAQIAPGQYELRVQAKGFAVQVLQVQLKPGANLIRLKLELSLLSATVNIGRDDEERRTDLRNGALNNVLTTEQVADLPDDPDVLEATLRRMAGPGATIRVDGFTGGRLPPKSQIASVRIIRSLYDTEFNEAGSALIDVTTKAGGGRWSGLLGFRFNDEALNARNAFAAERNPSQLRNPDFAVGGPIWRDRASLFVAGFASDSFGTREIFAATPRGVLRAQAHVPTRSFYGLAKLSYNISKSHFLNVGYERDTNRASGLAGHPSDLPERSFSVDSTLNRLRVSETGTFGPKVFNELRFQSSWLDNETIPQHGAAAVIVLGAFSSGGSQNQDRTRTHSFSLMDIISFPLAQHTLKLGGFVEREIVSRDSAVNAGGTFVFESLDDFLSSVPATYSVRINPAPVDVPQTRFGFFAQDDIRIRKNFTLSLGLRYQRQGGITDKYDFAPRVGFSWAVRNGWRTTLRGGGGVFYTWVRPDTFSKAAAYGQQSFETIIVNPGFPNPSAGGSVQVLPPSLWRMAPDLQTPYVIQTSLGVEQPIGKSLVLRGDFVHQRGVHLLRSRDRNSPLPGLGRPDARFGNLLQVESSASLRRDTLNLTATGSFMKVSYFFFGYTLEKATSDSDGAFSLPANSYDLRSELGKSSTGIPHSFFASIGYRPWKSLRISTNYSLQSPMAYNITTGRDDNSDSFFNDRPEALPRNSGRGTWQGNMQARLSWTLALKRLGNDSGGVPGTIIVDQTEAASGSVELAQKWSINFYLQANNLLNQTNYLDFSGVQTSPFFGKPMASTPGRRFELGMRFSF